MLQNSSRFVDIAKVLVNDVHTFDFEYVVKLLYVCNEYIGDDML